MADKENYYIPVEGKLVEVEEPVYSEYYRMSRRERYLEERDQENVVMTAPALVHLSRKGQLGEILGGVKFPRWVIQTQLSFLTWTGNHPCLGKQCQEYRQ